MAVTRACLIALVVALAVVEAAAGAAAGTSEQRRRQVRSLLKRLNKNPLASIQSADGDIIDCVPISKQPALDHPLLKNHTIQMHPSYHPEGLSDDSNIAPHPITQTWHQNGCKCPPNTIPIRRTKEEDVLRASSIRRYGKKRPRSIPNFFSVDDPNKLNVTIGHQHAIAYTPKARYYGTKTSINLWQPTIGRAKDFSLAQLWISGGSYSGNDLNTIEAGWQVYPELYGDRNTRLFIYWTRDAYRRTGCYNLQCSGFIQINNQIAIGGSFSPVSSYGGSQYEITILIWKDPKGGNWWLKVGNHTLGYWPSTIFSYLQISASYVMWGGEVYSPYADQTSTDMGSGHFPGEGLSKASYIRNIQVVDPFNKLSSPNVLGLGNKQPNCYNVESSTNSVNWGTYIFYGGPGKNPSCP
ncbi:hypothetical protein SETIT_8G238700v2 [Setaria italica]|uniref:Neprosin PEP catalytic domain-containing protein n=1 Tax=Setaria italica TaxID=4555 RepID=A0A368SB73_SETIT|nr:uncharacterized protein LOC101774282 [Setaria italica]RCV39621.1 hypothetical protein SETIT_8G238700v2 [Setaria italica]